MTLISETVASAISALNFTGIAGTYKQLLLIWGGVRHSGTGSLFNIRLNNSSSSIYTTIMTGSDTAVLYSTSHTSTSITNMDWAAFGQSANGGTLAKDVYGCLTIDNYASSTKAKTYYGSFGFFDNVGGGYRISNGFNGVFDSTTAITSVDIFRSSGAGTFSNTGDTTIRLYGVA